MSFFIKAEPLRNTIIPIIQQQGSEYGMDDTVNYHVVLTNFAKAVPGLMV